MKGGLPSSNSFSLNPNALSARANGDHLGNSITSGAWATLSAAGAQESRDQVKSTAMQPRIGTAFMTASSPSIGVTSYQAPFPSIAQVNPLPGGRPTQLYEAPASRNAAVRVASQQRSNAALRETSQGPRARSHLRGQSPRGESVPVAPARYGFGQSMSAVPAPQSSSFESQLQSVTAAALAQSANLGQQSMQNSARQSGIAPGAQHSASLQYGLESLDERLKRLENSVEAKLVKSTSEAMNACVVLCKGIEDRLFHSIESSRSSLLDEVEKLIFAFGPGTDGYQGVGSDRRESPRSSIFPEAPDFPELGGRLKALEEAVFGSVVCNLDHPRIQSWQGGLPEAGQRIKDVDQAISSAFAVSAQAQTELGQRGRGDILQRAQQDVVRIASAPPQRSAYNGSPPKVGPSASSLGSMDNDLDQVLDGLRGLETRMHLDSLQRANSSLPPSGLWNDPLNLKKPDAQEGLQAQMPLLSEGIVTRPHETESAGAEWSCEVRSLRTRLQNIILIAEARGEPTVAPAPAARYNNGNIESAVRTPSPENE